MDTTTIAEDNVGCWLDNHRGHYIGRDAIQLAVEFGFIIGLFEQWAVDTYDGHNADKGYPHEGMTELADDAVEWLNSGQDDCDTCHGTSKAVNGWIDKDGVSRCKVCSGTGRGPRIAGQNFPPRIPAGTAWSFNDGDFGLYWIETEGECAICDADGTHLSDDEKAD